MGNLCCCIYQRNQPDTVSVRYCSEIHLDEMHKTENNLNLYLNDVYEKECVLKASQEEVEFIQTGIETLVQEIVDEALDVFSNAKTPNDATEIKDYFERDLTDVYFPIKNGSWFQDLTDIKPTKNAIINVGSFYEGTRNRFPDEFDFIFLLFCGREELYVSSWSKLESYVKSCIVSVMDRRTFHYASPNGTREIYLNIGKDIENHGPAYMLKFIYNNARKGRHISVDLVPAYKIVVTDKPEWYLNYVNKYVKPKSFHREIMSAESCYYVRTISFTETEVSFIKNVLSERHVKVYRILKFLINGHGDDEIMKECLWEERRRNIRLGVEIKPLSDEPPYIAYSSYMIKTMMIYHHDECRNSATTDIGPCVLQVLEEMCKYKNTDKFPAFSRYGHKYGSYLVGYLQSVNGILSSMKTRTDSYSYERYKMKSVTMQYLEREHMDRSKYHLKQGKVFVVKKFLF